MFYLLAVLNMLKFQNVECNLCYGLYPTETTTASSSRFVIPCNLATSVACANLHLQESCSLLSRQFSFPLPKRKGTNKDGKYINRHYSWYRSASGGPQVDLAREI